MRYKAIISCFIVIAMMLSINTPIFYSSAFNNIRGDIDGDGVYSAADIVGLILLMKSGIDNADFNIADVDEDGYIAASDITKLISLIKNQDEELLNEPQEYSVTVNGQNVQSPGIVIINGKVVDLPFLSILSAFGASVGWFDNTSVKISITNIDFIGGIRIKEDEWTMYNYLGDTNYNYIHLTENSRYYKESNEVYLDMDTLCNTMLCLGFPILVNIDDNNKTIDISLDNTPVEYYHDLIVNGESVRTLKNVELDTNYPLIPFVSVIEALGMQVKWKSSDVATVTNGTDSYTLDLSKQTLLSNQDPLKPNYIKGAPGEARWVEIRENELYLDCLTVEQALYQLHCPVNIQVDHVMRVINVSSVTDEINYDYTLIVNGEEIAVLEDLRIYNYVAELPVALIFEALGAEVEWSSEKHATIDFGKVTYDLFTEYYDNNFGDFIYFGCDGNMILPLPGGGPVTWYSVPNELYLDSIVFRSFSFVNFPIEYGIKIDPQNNIISVMSTD